jgi:hypothetical protein
MSEFDALGRLRTKKHYKHGSLSQHFEPMRATLKQERRAPHLKLENLAASTIKVLVEFFFLFLV